MEFNTYQHRAHKTAIYPRGDALSYLALATNGEAGEIAEAVKKLIRDDGVQAAADIPEEKGGLLCKEIGDVLWYLSELASYLGKGLDDIAEENLEKLASRQRRGVLGGSGDER